MVLSTSGWGRPRPGHCTDKYLKGLVNWMPVLHLVSFCLFLNKDIPRAGYRYQTNSRIALKTGVCGEVSRGIGLSFLVIVLGTTACLVEHPYSHPWRCVLKSLSLCSSPLTRGQELLSEADDASVSVFATFCSPKPG